MKKGNWIALDKSLVDFLPKDKRTYTVLEAVFSFTYDLDCGNKYSINGYSELWGWGRNKVRRFINDLKTGKNCEVNKIGRGTGTQIRMVLDNPAAKRAIKEGQFGDSLGTVWGQGDIIKNKDLQTNKDSLGTVEGQFGDPTNNPKPKPKNINIEEKRKKPLKWEIPEGINRESWLEFEKHRQEIKPPLTDLARTKNVKVLLGKTNAEQKAIIDRSISNGWKGLFPGNNSSWNGNTRRIGSTGPVFKQFTRDKEIEE